MKIGAINSNYETKNLLNNNIAKNMSAPSFEGNITSKAGNTMKALAAAAILGMASVGMSSCVQPNDPTPIENPEDSAISVKDTSTYKTLKDMDFNIATEKFEPIEGQYTPKTGEITEISLKSHATKIANDVKYTLDRENSSEDKRLYKLNVFDHEKSKIIITPNIEITPNKEEKSLDIYYPIKKLHEKYTINEDNSISFAGDIEFTAIKNGNRLIDPNSYAVIFSDMKFTLAE